MNQEKQSIDFKFLKKIHQIFKKKKWDKAVALIDEKLNSKKINWNDKSIIYFYLTLAYAFYLKEDYQLSKRYLNYYLLKEFPENGEGILFLALFYLLEDKKPVAINLYIKLLKNPVYHKKAQSILEKLKKNKKQNLALLHPFLFYQHQFFIDKKFNFQFFLSFLYLFLVSLISLIIFFQLKNNDELFLQLKKKFKNFSKQEAIDNSLPKPFNFFHNEIKKAIAQQEVNQAILLYNQAIAINPPLAIVEKFKILKTFIPPPIWENIDMIIPWFKIQKSPALYQGTYYQFIGELRARRDGKLFFKSEKYPYLIFIVVLNEKKLNLKKTHKYQILFQLEKVDGNKIWGKSILLQYINTKVSS